MFGLKHIQVNHECITFHCSIKTRFIVASRDSSLLSCLKKGVPYARCTFTISYVNERNEELFVVYINPYSFSLENIGNTDRSILNRVRDKHV